MSEQIDEANRAAEQARQRYDDAAAEFAARLSRVAALLVRAQMPTASVLVFNQDEETVSADTIVEIVAVHDADGNELGELDATTEHEVRWRLVTAYDAGDGRHFNVADSDVYDTETVGSDWQDKNLLTLDIDLLVGTAGVQSSTARNAAGSSPPRPSWHST